MADPQSSTPKKRNWLKIILIAALGLFAFVAIIITFVFSLGSAPMKAGENFLKQLSSNQVREAYASASIQFQQSITEEQFNEFLAAFPVLTKMETVSFSAFEIENNVLATVRGTITGTDGQVAPITMQLVNENDQWRVLNLDLNPPPSSSFADTSDEFLE